MTLSTNVRQVTRDWSLSNVPYENIPQQNNLLSCYVDINMDSLSDCLNREECCIKSQNKMQTRWIFIVWRGRAQDSTEFKTKKLSQVQGSPGAVGWRFLLYRGKVRLLNICQTSDNTNMLIPVMTSSGHFFHEFFLDALPILQEPGILPTYLTPCAGCTLV
jgi:hypothetical protein